MRLFLSLGLPGVVVLKGLVLYLASLHASGVLKGLPTGVRLFLSLGLPGDVVLKGLVLY